MLSRTNGGSTQCSGSRLFLISEPPVYPTSPAPAEHSSITASFSPRRLDTRGARTLVEVCVCGPRQGAGSLTNLRGRMLIGALACVAGASLTADLLTSTSDGPGAAEPASVPAPACPAPKRGVWRGSDSAVHAVSVTFDDGPSAGTRAILRALRRHDAKATFFLVGREIPGREGIVRRAAREGHELGNHSTSHSALPSEADVANTSNLITRIIGGPPCVFRPPAGRTSRLLIRDVHRLGMTTVTW